MIVKAALLIDLKPQVKMLEADLRQRAGQEREFSTALQTEWEQAHKAERTAATYETWLDGEVTQAAVAWVLGTVFLRFCEDNGLIDVPYLAGPGERLAVASERQQEFFERHPHLTDRDWIVAGFEDMSQASPVAAGLFDRAHNPMWRITPSHQAAKDLLAFWRKRGESGDAPVVHDFIDPGWDTRFLGDLYQDLSEHAKKTYALLQTPEFVEEFILDLTLDPAIDEFGLEPDPPRARPDLPRTLRVIDPACGSGHFLLGAFRRLNDRWEQHAPAMDPWDRITRILSGLHGVDKNPFAVSVARFRLLLAVMKAGDVKRLADAHDFPLNIAVGDSLLHGRGGAGEQGELFGASGVFTYRSEDVGDYISSVDILGVNSYHVVVGNPPYIRVRDERERENYRAAYRRVCVGKYVLTVPFSYRFFQLARVAAGDRRRAGYIGQITSDSFMKREFGKKLIEDFFAQKAELTHVIDTSGAFIPGHGTPTVILFGRNMLPTPRPVRAVLRIHGEPMEPEDPAKGFVWRAILDQIGQPGSESDWVTVVDLPRGRLATHPWSLSGGGAGDLFQELENTKLDSMVSRAQSIGITSVTGEDDLYLLPRNGAAERLHVPLTRPLITGDVIRDFNAVPVFDSVWVYTDDFKVRDLGELKGSEKLLTTYRTAISHRRRFGTPMLERGLTWYEWQELYSNKLTTPLSITFAEVATHNHFVLDRGGKVFKQSAPVIKLPESASEEDHLALLGVLNSSTICFWLRQQCGAKGGSGIGRGIQPEQWMERYNFNSSNVEEVPLPGKLPLEFGRALDGLAQRVRTVEPLAVCKAALPTLERLNEARVEHIRIRGQMIALQEELDWEVYRIYGLLSEQEAAELRTDPDGLPELRLGERAFEIVLAQRMAAGEVETQWFARHGSTPITEIPSHWPQAYREVVQRRIEVIGRRRDLALIERPECKRRWQAEPWGKKESAALRAWLLDRCERRDLWFTPSDSGVEEPRPMTVNRLADRLRGDADFVSVARLYAGPDADLAEVVAGITDAEHVPYLAAMRYKDTGLRKRQQWEDTWEKQREEDATGQRLNIPVPPKYTSADFRKGSYWSNRGKLDVPKERFISYPLASPDGDGSLLLGWAGWDHREQAHALMTIIEDRATRDGWGRDRVIPLIAGLAEVMPWVRQWHGEVDPAFGMSPADAYAGYLEDQQRRCGATGGDLAAWRPSASGRGRPSRSGATIAANAATDS
ncbi:MAG TPA: BREX-2 system adenine-specific DNA-methyltransferase PglX [Streptosporangiaceae bacterium]|nr:BREX-2 system adenine-specific DNA-methyltransferase PglX [Streptosporangiaceae bacterium]HUZ27454.1 BREX-2 system adenine-specific DNA-methyltransferase PglX [Streptosporangiaceae bacterium]